MLIDRVRRGIGEIDGMGELMPVSEYVPPHKMPGYVPYDGVVALQDPDGTRWDEERVVEEFEANEVPFDKVIGVGENDDPRLDGDRLVFVKFREQPQV